MLYHVYKVTHATLITLDTHKQRERERDDTKIGGCLRKKQQRSDYFEEKGFKKEISDDRAGEVCGR